MSSFVFPGADHSRFAHSIGVMHTARRFLATVERETGKPLGEEEFTAVLAASLLHDVGHGPFSHTFESVTGESHEARTLEVIRDPATDVHKQLVKHDSSLPETLAAFFDDGLTDERRVELIPKYLTRIVSSQLDADRFDYLLRDSYSTGAQYGRFDATWLLQHLHLDVDKERFYLGHKGLIAAEAYVFARYHMYRTVYFHKTTRACELMFRLLFKRYRSLRDEGKLGADLASNVPPSIRNIFAGAMTLGQYLLLDDHSVTEFLKACKSDKDEVLRALGEGILDRKLFKTVEASEAEPADVAEFARKARDVVVGEDLDPEYFFVAVTPGDTPYEPYDPDQREPATQIYVQSTLGAIRELSRQSELTALLQKSYRLLRYYFPESIRHKINKVASVELKKERNR